MRMSLWRKLRVRPRLNSEGASIDSIVVLVSDWGIVRQQCRIRYSYCVY